MSNTTEQEAVLTVSGRIMKYADFDEKFPIVRASKLSLDDDFLKHEPQTWRQEKFKKSIVSAIKEGLQDFRRPAMDPSFEDGGIYYMAERRPAYEGTIHLELESFKGAKEAAAKVVPEKNSRIGTVKLYNAFLALLIKYLIEEREYEVARAWEAVCDKSKYLGNYLESRTGRFGETHESTGSRRIWNFYDLANMSKKVTDDEAKEIYVVGGNHDEFSYEHPLASVQHIDEHHSSPWKVWWIVLDV